MSTEILRPEQAWKRLEEFLDPLPPQRLPRRSALGRVLAEPLVATVDVPATDVSAMDGYAVDGRVATGTPIAVAGTIAAGDRPGFDLPAGRAVRIMTGAPVPRRADRVIPVEASDGGAEEVRFSAATEAGAHIRRRAEVLRRGDPLLSPGVLLTPGALSLLATHGLSEVAVHGAPRVAVLVTGDEVIPPEQEPPPGKLRDSNTDFLLAAGATLGLAFTSLGIAGDHREELRARLREGLGFDVLLVSGGVSMGEFDFVEGVLAELGSRSLFDAVAIQPGKPLVAARHPGTSYGRGGLVFGLPGNPASVMVTFWLFVRPVLRRLMGLVDGFWHGALAGELTAALPGAKGRDRFVSAEVSFAGGRLLVTPLPPRGSHDLAAFGQGAVLVRVRAGAPEAAPGDPCEVLPLVDWRTSFGGLGSG